ncbi:MAG: S1 RNA-binding domain-containing protein, partial [Candidatus Promineifilaceae bacterium]
VVDFGAFVLVAEGIEGLVHVSEIRGTQDFEPQDILYPDDRVLLRILQIDPQRQRLSLSQRRVRQNEEIAWIAELQQDSTEVIEEE